MLATENDAVLDAPADDGAKIDEAPHAGERAQTVRAVMAYLPRRWEHPLDMLMSDLPVSYAEIFDKLGLPVGSIGLTRGRCLARLRVLLEAS